MSRFSAAPHTRARIWPPPPAAVPEPSVSPSVAVIIPTYNAGATLEAALRSVASQKYSGRLEIFCIDGGSGDDTAEIAHKWGASMLANPARNQEAGTAIGIDATDSELVLLLDADDELPHNRWLARLVGALSVADDIAAADCLYHTWREADPPLVRLCALIGGYNPLAIELGWADRWAVHLGRWTGMPVEQQVTADALLVRIDSRRPPPLGSNGFLVRRSAILRTTYEPYIHPDVAADLAELGYRFARVRDGVIHHFAPSLRVGVHKARVRARDTVRNARAPRRPFRPSRLRLARAMASSLLLIGPAMRAIRGYRRYPDRAWALYPLWSAAWTISYLLETALALGSDRQPRPLGTQARELRA